MKYLCFDLGLKHTGVAWADLTKLPQPLETIHHQNIKQLSVQIKKIISKHQPNIIILGQPPKGVIKTLSIQLKDVIKEKYSGEIYLQDEDFSSRQAKEQMIQTGKSAFKRRQKHHSAAASVILQNFLDQHPFGS